MRNLSLLTAGLLITLSLTVAGCSLVDPLQSEDDLRAAATRVDNLSSELEQVVSRHITGKVEPMPVGYQRCGVDANDPGHVEYATGVRFLRAAHQLSAAAPAIRSDLAADGWDVTQAGSGLRVTGHGVTGLISGSGQSSLDVGAHTECFHVSDEVGERLRREGG